MAPVTEAIETIRAVLGKVGAAELARMSGVPYTTIREWQEQEFRARSVITLEKLSDAASLWLEQHPEGAAQEDAAA